MRIRRDNDALHDEDILLLAKVSDALAHPVRIKIFQFVMKQNTSLKKVCNKDIVANFDYAQATISQHIKTLVKSGLIEVEKKDRYSYYYVNIGLHAKYANVVKKFIRQSL
ncbi:MAG: helix-turn-helix domain-containing protein [Eubacteriales bacterium]|nr:helix-turn-helix domain-containing protein [Eubacteriales bacterium]MDY3332334.1 helix-turn-helix domain-containing protein [Gallibacter sp.]